MINLSFWGDCKIDDVETVQLSDQIKSILSSCDLNVVNFEAPVHNNYKPIKKSGPNLSQSTDTPAWLEKNGFNVISLANNHIMDFGVEGYKKSIDLFHSSFLVGAGDWSEAYKLKIVEINNKKIGFLSFTHCEFGTLTDRNDRKHAIGTAWICNPDVPSIILEGKKLVDYLFIISHAGVENIDVPLPEWRDIYKSFIDLGADAVVASHPHLPQGWEIHKGRPVFYSLGNFCFQKQVIPKNKMLWNESFCVIFSIYDDSMIHFKVKNIHYTGSELIIRTDPDIISHTKKINNYLFDEETYLRKVDNYCKDLLAAYKNYFSASGYHYLVAFNWKFLRKISSIVLKRREYDPVHIINNIRCESHRWAFLRAVKNENQIM